MLWFISIPTLSTQRESQVLQEGLIPITSSGCHLSLWSAGSKLGCPWLSLLDLVNLLDGSQITGRQFLLLVYYANKRCEKEHRWTKDGSDAMDRVWRKGAQLPHPLWVQCPSGTSLCSATWKLSEHWDFMEASLHRRDWQHRWSSVMGSTFGPSHFDRWGHGVEVLDFSSQGWFSWLLAPTLRLFRSPAGVISLKQKMFLSLGTVQVFSSCMSSIPITQGIREKLSSRHQGQRANVRAKDYPRTLHNQGCRNSDSGTRGRDRILISYHIMILRI